MFCQTVLLCNFFHLGSSAADQFQGLQGGATEGLDLNTASPQIPNQATSPLIESSMTDNNGKPAHIGFVFG